MKIKITRTIILTHEEYQKGLDLYFEKRDDKTVDEIIVSRECFDYHMSEGGFGRGYNFILSDVALESFERYFGKATQ